jgi:murein DD-endopeptidase MepM/ murein hydrolase activator NlpD
VLWKDEEEEALGLKSLAGEAPICINIGRNCQMAKKIGSHGYQVLGSFALGSTEVSVNGVRRQLGVDYTESDPAHGMIEFSDALDIDAQVWVCYSASSFANPWDEGLTATAGVFDFPTIGAITGTFGDQSSGWGEAIWHGSYYSHFHNGVDFGVPVGTPVRAAADGMVSWEDQFAGGSMIHIYHGPPAVPISCRTTYAHLSSRIVAPGEFVTQGQIIGTSGDSGQVTGPHLHWGMVVAGSAEDPLPWTTLPGFPL